MRAAELNPMQARVRAELFAPAADDAHDPALVRWLRAELGDRLAAAEALVPRDAELVLSKSALEALGCEGRYLDRLDTPVEWNAAMVRGQLAHAALRLDVESRGRLDDAALVEQAWRELVHEAGPAGAFLATLEAAEAAGLRGDARQLVVEVREQLPPLEPRWVVRVEPALKARLAHGRIVLFGRPDLALGRVDARRRRMLLLDLKTGSRQVQRHRDDLRFYALVATLKHGVAPVRVATYYLDEADWDAEDVHADTLRAAAERVGRLAERAARLTFHRPADEHLRLSPGPPCRWCRRAPGCPAATDLLSVTAAG